MSDKLRVRWTSSFGVGDVSQRICVTDDKGATCHEPLCQPRDGPGVACRPAHRDDEDPLALERGISRKGGCGRRRTAKPDRRHHDDVLIWFDGIVRIDQRCPPAEHGRPQGAEHAAVLHPPAVDQLPQRTPGRLCQSLRNQPGGSLVAVVDDQQVHDVGRLQRPGCSDLIVLWLSQQLGEMLAGMLQLLGRGRRACLARCAETMNVMDPDDLPAALTYHLLKAA